MDSMILIRNNLKIEIRKTLSTDLTLNKLPNIYKASMYVQGVISTLNQNIEINVLIWSSMASTASTQCGHNWFKSWNFWEKWFLKTRSEANLEYNFTVFEKIVENLCVIF